MEEVTKDCLIDKGTRMWNAEMVDGIFAPQEAEEIKNIPLAREATEGSLYCLGSMMIGIAANRGTLF